MLKNFDGTTIIYDWLNPIEIQFWKDLKKFFCPKDFIPFEIP